MGTRNPRIDEYISNAAEFAQPVLQHVRELMHAACPDVEETMKWSHPHFRYHRMMAGMAAFKQHCWLRRLIRSTRSMRVRERNTSSGLWKPGARARGSDAWSRRFSGWLKENNATGNIRSE